MALNTSHAVDSNASRHSMGTAAFLTASGHRLVGGDREGVLEHAGRRSSTRHCDTGIRAARHLDDARRGRDRRIAAGSRSSWVNTMTCLSSASFVSTCRNPSILDGSIAWIGSSSTRNRNGLSAESPADENRQRQRLQLALAHHSERLGVGPVDLGLQHHAAGGFLANQPDGTQLDVALLTQRRPIGRAFSANGSIRWFRSWRRCPATISVPRRPPSAWAHLVGQLRFSEPFGQLQRHRAPGIFSVLDQGRGFLLQRGVCPRAAAMLLHMIRQCA